jgi:uncharacterized membrane protein
MARGEQTRGVSSRVFFDAVLHPHRSLSPRGFAMLMAFTAALMFAIGAAFAVAGAWPVFGLCGLEFLLLYLAFRINYRSGRSCETVRLSDAGLEVRRYGPGGEVAHWRFEPAWLRVTMDDPPRHESRLTLASHGRSLVIGSFLTPQERLEVAIALKRAIAAYRTAPPPEPA